MSTVLQKQPAHQLMRRQRGALTIFTALLVLTLMTLLLVYASRVGILEQRVSGNEMRQKLAFQAAEAGLDYATEYLLAAGTRLISKKAEAAPYTDADGNTAFRAGWFADGNIHWKACPGSPGANHPCGGDIPTGGAGSFYYDDPATVSSNLNPKFDSLPLDPTVTGNLPPNTAVRTTVIMCPRELDDATCLGSAGIPEEDDISSEAAKFMMWILAWGYSECNDVNGNGSFDIPDECAGRAEVARPVGSIENFAGAPTVPLVSRNTLPTSGTAEVVPNPNGGGEGVPSSIWANGNGTSGCEPLDTDGTVGSTIEVQGAFKTCEMHEWYGQDSRPEDGKCAVSNCQCDYPGPEPISYRQSGDAIIGIDVITDTQFPCDLFEFYFGVPKAQYQAVKANATVIDDCSVLTSATPSGFYWFSGDTCTLDDVGTMNNPVILLSAANTRTVLNGNSAFFGILYLSDVEDPEGDAVFKPGGGATVYGAAIVDVLFPSSGYSGTFRVVYNEAALLGAGGAGGIGGLASGWRDFGLPNVTWES